MAQKNTRRRGKAENKAQSTGILILGMHRSGTSALTGVLNLLGVALGERLMPAGKGNETGHWESLPVYEAHEKLLTALGRHWDDPREMPRDWLAHPEAIRCAGAVQRFVDEELSHAPVWAVKEPRLCRLLPMWRTALSDRPLQLGAVLMVRDPFEVAASLARRDGMEHARAHLLWAQHLLEAERASRGMTRVLLRYDELLADWRACVARIASAFHIEWRLASDAAAEQIDAYLQPSLRHQRSDDGSAAVASLPDMVRRLYAACSANDVTDARLRAIARISDDYVHAAGLFGPCLDELTIGQQQREARAVAAEAVVVQGLVRPQMLAEQIALIRDTQSQSHATFLKSEQSGVVLVEMVRQLEAQRHEHGQRSEQTGALLVELVRQIEAQRSEQQHRLGLAQAEARTLESERVALAARHDALTGEYESLTHAYALLQARMDAALAEQRSAQADASRELALERDAHAQATQRAAELQAALAQASARADGIELTAQALREALTLGSARVQDFEMRLHLANTELVSLYASTSWRLTAPLRFLRRLFSRSSGAAALGPAPTSGRRRLGRLAESIYRRAPLSLRCKRAFKGFVFRLTGPLLARTAAYQRWDADRRTHAADDIGGNADLRAPQAEHAQSLPTTALTESSVWRADGLREWQDYQPLRARMLAARSDERVRVPPRALPMIQFDPRRLADAAAGIKLPLVPAEPEVTILVPMYNHVGMTLECIASIAAHVDADTPTFEVLVADDGSDDESVSVLRQVRHLRCVRQPRNLGFLRNCNLAAREAHGRLLLLLNNDVQVTAGWLRALVDCIDAASYIGAVGPKIVYPSGWLQEAGTRLKRDASSQMIGLNDLPGRPEYGYDRDVDYVTGACLLTPRELFIRLGGFDERYVPAYCEDSDYCLRLRAEGLRRIYCAGATVVHHLSKTSDALAGGYKTRCIARNLDQFSQRWQADLDRMDAVRTIAFYLPQFHPVPENDRWWGQGFTEWTNVTKAKPNFIGHDQPRVPADLGYYDLRAPEVMAQQAELARRYGVGGFCYYYYWFAGHRLLERPIEQMLASGTPAFPFCLCWANENWTRRWDGEEHDVLMAQHHSEADDVAVIRDLMRYFRSPQYIRIGGRPLLVVYRVGLFPDFRQTAARWRQVCRDEGIGEIYLAHVESFDMVSAGIRPADVGCDAGIEFPPHGMADPYPLKAPLLNPNFQGAVADYRDMAARYVAREVPGYPRFPGVATGWDNTARRQNNSYCFEHATPGAFQAWLEMAIERAKRQFTADERIVFINAWNEWAEGAYLEPDQRFGHAYLQAHANACDADRLLQAVRVG